MWVLMAVGFFLWGVANFVFAFVDPPSTLARLMPRKIWFMFALLPEPWDRRLGMIFNGFLGLIGVAGTVYYGLLMS